jgi:chromosome transmission fidelity protein 18
VNGSDERSEGMLKQRVLRAMESTLSFKGKAKPNCIILDEIDGADAVSAIQALVKIIRAPKPVKGSKSKVEYLRRPIIFICNNRYASTLKPLLPYAKHFAVSPPVDSRLVVRLRQILANEQLSLMAGGSLLGQLVATACGDIRSCLHTLQFATAKARDEAEDAEGIVDISHELKGVLNGNGLKDEKSDIASTINAIFRKEKSASKKSVVNVLDCVDVSCRM